MRFLAFWPLGSLGWFPDGGCFCGGPGPGAPRPNAGGGHLFGQRRPVRALPLRGELLSLEGLEERARTLAADFALLPPARSGRYDALPRLDENIDVLTSA